MNQPQAQISSIAANSPVGGDRAANRHVDWRPTSSKGQLADGASVPATLPVAQCGPMLRVRVGDTVELSLATLATTTSTLQLISMLSSGPGGRSHLY